MAAGRPRNSRRRIHVRPHSIELRPLRTGAEWDRLHAIRKTCLFDVYHPWIPYDAAHPDDRDPGNHPLGLFGPEGLVGTIRIDLKPDRRAIFRMVAVSAEARGRHLGDRMMGLAEAYARRLGATAGCLNAVREAIGFYARQGYLPERWPGCTACPTSLPMAKLLAAAEPMAQVA
jgi:GNAT superfamily N-acetyltransferase